MVMGNKIGAVYLTLCVTVISQVRGTAGDVAMADCRRALDVVFLLEYSERVGDADWHASVDLVTRASAQLRPSVSGTHIALMTFADTSSIVHPLSHQLPLLAYLSKSMFFEHESNFDLRGAMLASRSTIFTGSDGDRPAVPDVLVVITHGVSDNVQKSRAAAEMLKSDGIRIVTVGIGVHGVDELRHELRSIATYTEDSDKLIAAHGYHLTSLLPLLLHAICKREFDASEGSVRLADEAAASGRLEVFVQGDWAAVFSASWTTRNSEVACRDLGFNGSLAWFTMDTNTSHSPRTGLGNITCVGTETHLLDCEHDSSFVFDSSCDHRRNVHLRCLCSHCDDYRPRDNVRLADGSSTYGRVEVFSPEHRWGGMCRDGWTPSNTRVACRHFGFLDGADTYNTNTSSSTTVSLYTVNCTGNESSLFDCSYQTMSADDHCEAVNILCQCKACLEPSLLKAPLERQVRMGANVEFVWNLNQTSGGRFEFWFLSSKNRRLVLRRTNDLVEVENTEHQHRVTLIGDNEKTLGFRLSNAKRDDMGIYALHVPLLKLFNSQAILFVSDFAVIPDSVVRRALYDSVVLSWDLTSLRQLRDISLEIMLTTPATGRLHLDYYYSHWIRDNRGIHLAQKSPDHLHPTVMIENVTTRDAGDYAIELELTSPVHRWLNATWTFRTALVILEQTDTSLATNISRQTDTNSDIPLVTFVLGTLVAVLGLIVCALLVREGYRRRRQSKVKRRPLPDPTVVPTAPRPERSNPSRRYRNQTPPGDRNLSPNDDDYNNTVMYEGSTHLTEMTTFDSALTPPGSQNGTVDINIAEERCASTTPGRPTYAQSGQSRRQQFASSSSSRRRGTSGRIEEA